jgi:site-specific DNA-cytosine methylase
MRELHLFAGAGGGILGGHLLGHTTVAAVEIEPYCQQVLKQRQADGILPEFPIFGDIRDFNGIEWMGKVDVIAGGFPCTDISVAGGGGWNRRRSIRTVVRDGKGHSRGSTSSRSLRGKLASTHYSGAWKSSLGLGLNGV